MKETLIHHNKTRSVLWQTGGKVAGEKLGKNTTMEDKTFSLTD